MASGREQGLEEVVDSPDAMSDPLAAGKAVRPADLYEEIAACRLCGADELTPVMDFGHQYLASAFVESNEGHPLADVQVPMTVVLCDTCGLVQLRETVRRDVLFRDYFYRSATNPMMRVALNDVVEDVAAQAVSDGWWVDVGANDGTLLEVVPERFRRAGIEPASNIDWGGLDPAIRMVNGFFSLDAVREATGGEPVSVLTSIAMLYSVPDVGAFAATVKDVLAEDGVWAIQVSWLPAMLDTLSFYDVVHEHVYYFTLETLTALLERHGLKPFDASLNAVNGGSLRVLATHAEAAREPTEGLLRVRQEEQRRRLRDPATYADFWTQVEEMKTAVTEHLRAERAAGRLVIALGASTKGNVLLQLFGIDRELLPYISERNPEKVGLRTLGTDIELVSEEQARAMEPSCMLVLVWFFKEELLRRERSYLEAGGSLLFPMPHPHLVTADGEHTV